MVTAIAVSLAVAVPSSAAPANCTESQFQNHNWGYRRDPSGARASGAQSQIEAGNAALCDPPAGYAAASLTVAMLVEKGAGSSPGFAWVGWIRADDGSGAVRYVGHASSSSGSGAPIIFDFYVSLGDTHVYKATWKNGSGEDNKIHFIVCDGNGSNCMDEGETSFDGDTWTDSYGIIQAETNTEDVDMAGIVGARNDYDNILWRHGTQAWDTANSQVCKDTTLGQCGGDSGTRYHLNDISNSHFQTWTDPL